MKKANYIIGQEVQTRLRRSSSSRKAGRVSTYLVGIDEVGRGPLAGPVTVAAAAVPGKFKVRNLKLKVKLKDSKKLSAKQREEWMRWIRGQGLEEGDEQRIFYATASVYPKVIDRINISQAANLAATRALLKVHKFISHKFISSVLLDGGLYIKNANNLKLKTNNLKTIARGDEKFNCIKLASIVAKVRRDKAMKKLHKKYPIYGFDEHMGYGTKRHIRAIKKHGISEAHRLSFIQNFI